MRPVFFFVRDWFSRWAVDRAGVESGSHTPRDLRAMLDDGEITPRTWLRHVLTRRYALVGEVLLMNSLAGMDEFESWFPMRRFPGSTKATQSPA